MGSPELTDDHRPLLFAWSRFSRPHRGVPEEQVTMSVPIALRVYCPPQIIAMAVDERNIRLHAGRGGLRGHGNGAVQVSERGRLKRTGAVAAMGTFASHRTLPNVYAASHTCRSRCWYMQGV